MWAFDLIELDGDDLRLEPLDARKATLARVLASSAGRCCAHRPSRSTYDQPTEAHPNGRAGYHAAACKPDAFFLSQFAHSNLSHPLFRNPDRLSDRLSVDYRSLRFPDTCRFVALVIAGRL